METKVFLKFILKLAIIFLCIYKQNQQNKTKKKRIKKPSKTNTYIKIVSLWLMIGYFFGFFCSRHFGFENSIND